MQNKKTLIIEIGIVGLILIILSAVMLPKFLQTQRTGEPRRLIQNLQMLVDAIEAYQTDYDGMPASIVQPMDNLLQVMRPFESHTSKAYFLHDIKKPYQFFHENGYLSRLPNFALLDDFIESDLRKFNGQPVPMGLWLKGQAVQSKPGIQKLEKFYVCQFWFKSEPDDIKGFVQLYENERTSMVSLPPIHDLYEPDGFWMNPECLYSPTNGFHSAGYLYADSEGRYSPWK